MKRPSAKQKWESAYRLTALAAACALTVLACLLLYQYDNKYTRSGPRAENGLLVLDKQALNAHPLLFLVEGWEYYGGRLLTPATFAASSPQPSAIIFIGQYGGFEAGDSSAPPHGSATYRLVIRIPDEPDSYLLELPEIFSAYHAYVNGKLAQSMGDPAPSSYRPETGNRVLNITAGGQIELLIAVSDFSHFYSGLVYPPAFGKAQAVNGLLSARLIFRSLLVAFALAIGILALFIGFASRQNTLAIFYGLLCLFFIGYISYPLIHTLISGYQPFYALENISFCAMLTIVMLLQNHLFRRGKKWDAAFIGCGILMCLVSAVLPLTLSGGKLWVMGAYTRAMTVYEWAAAAYLTTSAAQSMRLSGGGPTHKLLTGMIFLDAALVMDRLLPLHEPIVSGWFPELASFMLVLCIGLAVAREVAEKYRDNAVLEERANGLERLSKLQHANYELLNERIEETRTLQHDLRHHFVMIEGLLRNRAYEELAAYVRKFQATVKRAAPVSYSQNQVVNVLMQHYAQLAEKQSVKLALQLEIDKYAAVSETDLCTILSNLLENALEACARQSAGARFIALSIGQKPSMLAIRMENSTDGQVAANGGAFLSSKASGRKGYGLDSVKTIAARYGGDTEFTCDNNDRLFISTVLLML